jgi:serine/threonine-protein kinase
VSDAVDYALQACEALADAHSIGIVHRDLKPSNLFVIKRLDGSPCIKLIDFGISKIQMPGADGAEGEMTATAVMMGSPLYMAPEQMASARDVDGRADIWSLGILLHTVLTGQPPFRAATVMGVYEQIIQGAPPVRKQRPGVPEGLEAVILTCLKKDRKERYADVGELAEALAPFGPEHGFAAAARIKRIIAARRGTSTPPPPDLPLPVATIASAVSPIEPRSKGSASLGGASLGGSASQIATKSSAEKTPISDTQPSATTNAGVDGPGTAGPWDQRTPPPSSTAPRGPSRAVLAAGAAVLLGGAVISFFAMRSGSGTPPAPAISAAPATSSTIAPAEPEPSVSPSGTASAPPASASAPLPASAPAPVASASAKPFPPLPGGARPRLPRPKSGDDHFGTQK